MYVGYCLTLFFNILPYTQASITKMKSINKRNWVLFNMSCSFRVLSLSCWIAVLIKILRRYKRVSIRRSTI